MIIKVDSISLFKQKAFQWAAEFDTCCYLDSNKFNDPYSKFDTLIAVGIKSEIISDAGRAFEGLARFRANNPGWITGFLGYDLKNEVEKLTSSNADGLAFPDLYFFAPQIIISIKDNGINITGNNEQEIFDTINRQKVSTPAAQPSVKLRLRFTRTAYIEQVKKIQEHITRGDIYVTNFCQEFYAEGSVIDPAAAFQKLQELSPAPFASFFKWKGNYMMCASPERFLAKRGSKLVSQPIKGTARRDADEAADKTLIQELRNHPKEQQENVMIVDLVRNDLTRSARAGTVKTEELFGIRSFKQVHQMVSTVICELDENVTPIQAIRNAFPMGSMTGAPKVSAMQLMERYEHSKRGIYSGAIGYFSPDGDFDFNVVIRTLLYNANNQYLSFQTGSAITYHAQPEKEYEECMLKAKAILEVLGADELL